ncbi:hypothetical protein NBRC3257_2208 [Gluconobacter thailandicus NBRC 3257]|uniref:LysR family transcriptional regulator n=1 Tax=Gluconobacter thailandicus NBRC 3257 TaxID=1381097 RepID=A0ABQ0IYB7_GLUTH|nr:hypothetical protein B932_0167 [Gluconobacter oxydans H24]GAC88502.1 hypothetical protein NBRC3255_2163 [Gluconobacter thailandicus NBRC 3255]GAD27209.1 hypothetical protein NBRC3257_2208 [Gluconobacter thailandicus NBRC 3257]
MPAGLVPVEFWLLFPAGRMMRAKVRAMADFVTEIAQSCLQVLI